MTLYFLESRRKLVVSCDGVTILLNAWPDE